MDHIPSWFGTEVCDPGGTVVGRVRDVYYDEATWRPAWLLVDDGARLLIAPAAGTRSRGGAVVLAHDRELIDSSPTVALAPPVLAGEPLLRLAHHYRVRVDRCGAHAAVHAAATAPARAA